MMFQLVNLLAFVWIFHPTLSASLSSVTDIETVPRLNAAASGNGAPVLPMLNLRNTHHDSNVPEQIHITLGGSKGFHNGSMIISWLTPHPSESHVLFGLADTLTTMVEGYTTSYTFGQYQSGILHHVTLPALQSRTTYSYRCGDNTTGVFSEILNFTTPPAVGPNEPISFSLVGDLGQTSSSAETVAHILKDDTDMTLLVGDLSYADSDQPRWDNWGRLVQPLLSTKPFVPAAGNHEVENRDREPKFLSYKTRYQTPAARDTHYYSFEAGCAHVTILNSYEDYHSGSAQHQWLVEDLKRVNREVTPWLIVIVHAPWYNSNYAHHLEGEEMRVSMEPLLYSAKVDIVFAGHVHAYERMFPVYNRELDSAVTTYINIGDGGNREGLATRYYSRPAWSAFREPSFGHGVLVLTNSKHAEWGWHRNQDKNEIVSDKVIFGCDRRSPKECSGSCMWDEVSSVCFSTVDAVHASAVAQDSKGSFSVLVVFAACFTVLLAVGGGLFAMRALRRTTYNRL